MIKTVWQYGDTNIEDARKVRFEVFIKEQNVPADIEWDETDKIAKHLMVYDGEKCIATGRLYTDHSESGLFHIGRVAVLKDHRGQYIGDFLMRALLNSAFNFEGAEVVEIGAQLPVVDFYKRFGFEPFGEEYVEAGIRHIKMRVTKETVVFGHC